LESTINCLVLLHLHPIPPRSFEIIALITPPSSSLIKGEEITFFPKGSPSSLGGEGFDVRTSSELNRGPQPNGGVKGREGKMNNVPNTRYTNIFINFNRLPCNK
jgi:hypothetical protein